MSDPETPRISIGNVIRVEDPHYRYGSGPLLLRIAAIGASLREPDGLWLEVRGHEIRWNGDADPRERHAAVRLAAVRTISSGRPP